MSVDILASACLQPTEASKRLVAFILGNQRFGVSALERIFGVPLEFTPEELAEYAKALGPIPPFIDEVDDTDFMHFDGTRLGIGDNKNTQTVIIVPAPQETVTNDAVQLPVETESKPEDVYWDYWTNMNEFVETLPPHFQISWARATSLVCWAEKWIPQGSILFPFDFLQPACGHDGHHILSAHHAYDLSEIIYGNNKLLPEWLLGSDGTTSMNGDDLSIFLEAVACNQAVKEHVIRQRAVLMSQNRRTFFK